MQKLETKLSLDTILSSPNLAEELSDKDLACISGYCVAGFETDLSSREAWEVRMTDAMKLALQLKEEKNFPWQGASNVKFPLITIAAIQYHARAYPTLVKAPDLVRFQTWGADPEGLLAKNGTLIGQHMSWQCLEEDKNWESETDRALLVQPILGSVFKKSYFDSIKGHNVSEMVLPADFVVNYWTKDLDTSPRMTHIQYYFGNDFRENEVRGLWKEYTGDTYYNNNTPSKLGPLAEARDQMQGSEQPSDDYEQPICVLEMCTWCDLDGDGYKEPYTITFRHDNGKILRIKARFFEIDITYGEGKRSNDIAHIKAENPYTKIPFIPSPDGGFYDLGFGVLLGPINQAIDSSINQLIDAGTMSNAGGGFLGRGVRVKGGSYSFTPNEWKRVDSTGDDLRANIFPLPVREPSATLFQLLSLLISYGEKIAGATEATSGENVGQNTKVGTMESMLEQGLQIFNGIYKRTWLAFKCEFRKLYNLNKLFLEKNSAFISLQDAQQKQILQEAYKLPDTALTPAADPVYMSRTQRQRQAQIVRAASLEKPLYNNLALERWYLETLEVPAIDSILLKEEPQPGPPPAVQVAQIKAQAQAQKDQAQLEHDREAAISELQLKLVEMQNEADLNQAKAVELQAKAVLAIEMAGTAQSDALLAEINSQIGLAKVHHENTSKVMDSVLKLKELHLKEKEINTKVKDSNND